MNLAELLLGQIPEAVYFSLFLIFTKQIKEKRILFTVLMVIEYLLLMNIFPYSIWSHILYFGISYILMKILYKYKCQITDIFTLGIASIVLMAISIISYFILLNNSIIAVIINRILMICVPIIFRNKLFKIENIYKLFWNKNTNDGIIIKSTTFRAMNTVLFNLMFVVINVCMLYASIVK